MNELDNYIIKFFTKNDHIGYKIINVKPIYKIQTEKTGWIKTHDSINLIMNSIYQHFIDYYSFNNLRSNVFILLSSPPGDCTILTKHDIIENHFVKYKDILTEYLHNSIS